MTKLVVTPSASPLGLCESHSPYRLSRRVYRPKRHSSDHTASSRVEVDTEDLERTSSITGSESLGKVDP